ncbi:MAG: TatD-related deoxyribonuclease [Ramlibacter sp.]|nr:TatD-related deoxyribonuclease [Ramlibacter sp.]MDX6714019.1 TatD DNase family protein [Baekduia sp.]
MFVDAHVHLNRFLPAEDAAAAADRAGVMCLAMTESPADYEAWLPVLGGRRRVRLALGAHPLRAEQLGKGELDRFAVLAGTVSYLGEVGLDGSRDGRASLPAQRRVFARVLDAARNGRALLSVHSRGAEAEVVEALGAARARGVLHWYSGALSQVDGALEQGLYFSVNASMLATQKGLRLLRALPRDRVLTESDGPFARVGRQRLSPVDIPALVQRIAEFWGCDVDEAAAQVWSNMRAVAPPRAGAINTA